MRRRSVNRDERSSQKRAKEEQVKDDVISGRGNTVREIIDKNRNVMIRHLTPSPEMMNLLAERNVFTESMIKDITDPTNSRSDVIRAMLALLPLRGQTSFNNFCDVLQMTGHSLIAGLLCDDANNRTQVDTTDLSSRYPSLSHLTSSETINLKKYIQEKIKEWLVGQKLRTSNAGYEDAQKLKQTLIEEQWTHQRELAIKDESIQQAAELMQTLKGDMDVRISQLKHIIAQQTNSQADLRAELQVQYNFNVANEKSLHRYLERIENQDRLLLRLCSRLNSEGNSYWDEKTNSFREGLDVTRKFDKFLEKVKELESYKVKYHQLLRDQNQFLSKVLGSTVNVKQISITGDESLLGRVNDYVGKRDSKISHLQDEIDENKNRILYLENRHREVIKEYEAIQTRAMELEYKLNCGSDSESDDETNKISGRSSQKMVSYNYEEEIVRLKVTINEKDATINMLEMEIGRLHDDVRRVGAVKHSRLNGLVTTRDATRFVTKSGNKAQKESLPKKLPPLKNKETNMASSAVKIVTDFDLSGWECKREPTYGEDVFQNSKGDDTKLMTNLPPPSMRLRRQTSTISVSAGYKFGSVSASGQKEAHEPLQQNHLKPQFGRNI